MLTTKFKTKVHKCSVCDYKSFVKIHVQTHLKKCKDAEVITEDTIVSHYDKHDVEKVCATLYQCSKCSYTSPQPTPMKTHLTKCEGEMLSSKRILSFSPIPKKETKFVGNGSTVNITQGENSIANSAARDLFQFNFYFAPGTPDETIAAVAALIKALTPNSDASKLLNNSDVSELPSVIYKIIKDVDPRLDNKLINKNDVVSKKDGTRVPRVKHSKTEVVRLMKTLYEFVKSDIPFDCLKDTDYDIDDIIQVRRTLLPFFYKERTAEMISERLNDTNDPVSTIQLAEDNDIIPDADFYEGCLCLVENPIEFRRRTDVVSKKVRYAAKKYLETIPIEKRDVGRPCNLVSTNCP